MKELIIDVICWVAVFGIPLGFTTYVILGWYRKGA